MVLRKHLLATLSTGLLPVISLSLAHAMTVQPVQVKSALGEPFHAEIVITDLGQIDIRDIQVTLANNQELSRLGVAGSELANTLDLSLLATQSNKANTQGVIVIRSRQPINDPFLEFAVKIQAGPNNRIQRINALIDPPEHQKTAINLVPAEQNNNTETPIELATSEMPTIEDATSSSGTQTSSEQALTTVNTAPPSMEFATSQTPANNVVAPNTGNQAPKEVDISSTEQKNKQRHLVRRNESLWKIAKQLQPQLNQPIDQIMQHIRQLNNDAFIAGNPNQLKRGATLVLPERDQNATLVNNALPPAKPKAAAPLKAAKQPAQTAPRRGRLPKAEMTLVAPTNKGLAQGNSADGRNSGLQPLSHELSLKVGQERRKTVLLQHEVSEMEAQLALNDKKIAMLNAKLAEMEYQLKMRNQAQKSSNPVVKKVSQAVVPVVALVAVALSGLSPNVAQAAEGDSSGFPFWIIPVGLLVVALIIKFLQGKQQETPSNKRTAAARAKAKRTTTRSSTTAPREQTTTQQPTVAHAAQAPVAIDRTPPAAPASDTLQEAQSFIDREQFAQAAEILKKSISDEPARTDIQIKLLEVYALENAISAFEQQYYIVAGFNQPDITAHADKLRQLLQEENKTSNDDLSLDFTPSLVAQPAAVPVDQSLAELEAEFGFDQQLAPSTIEIQPPQASNDNVIEFDLSDFDQAKPLTESTEVITEQPALTPQVANQVDQPVEETLDLEFDLSDSFDLGETTTPPVAPQPTELKKDVADSTTSRTAEFDLDDIKLDDTNWASGFDDQEFDIGATHTPAVPVSVETPAQPVTPVISNDTNANESNEFLLKEFPFLSSLDVQQTNLELAESYINLGEHQSAKELLEEVIQQGSTQQQTQAQQLIRKLAS